MNSEPTLSDLEDQEPTSQEDLERELRGVNSDLGNVRVVMRLSRNEEKSLMTRRSWIRTQLRLLREPLPHVTVPAELAWDTTPVPDGHFNGTTEPECPDCTMDDA